MAYARANVLTPTCIIVLCVVTHTETLLLALLLTIIPLSSKFICSFLAGTIFRFSKNEIGLLFGLSSAHAAVVIAISLIGFQMELVSTPLFNATVILVLISCITSSVVTDFFGKRVVIADSELTEENQETADRVVVPYANPKTVQHLLDIAVNITYPNQKSLIYPLTVVQEDDETYRKTIIIYVDRVLAWW